MGNSLTIFVPIVFCVIEYLTNRVFRFTKRGLIEHRINGHKSNDESLPVFIEDLERSRWISSIYLSYSDVGKQIDDLWFCKMIFNEQVSRAKVEALWVKLVLRAFVELRQTATWPPDAYQMVNIVGHFLYQNRTGPMLDSLHSLVTRQIELDVSTYKFA